MACKECGSAWLFEFSITKKIHLTSVPLLFPQFRWDNWWEDIGILGDLVKTSKAGIFFVASPRKVY